MPPPPRWRSDAPTWNAVAASCERSAMPQRLSAAATRLSDGRQIVASPGDSPHIRGMKLVTRIAIIAAAVSLGAATLGCGIISQVKQAANNLETVTEVAQKLGDSTKLTFTA